MVVMADGEWRICHGAVIILRTFWFVTCRGLLDQRCRRDLLRRLHLPSKQTSLLSSYLTLLHQTYIAIQMTNNIYHWSESNNSDHWMDIKSKFLVILLDVDSPIVKQTIGHVLFTKGVCCAHHDSQNGELRWWHHSHCCCTAVRLDLNGEGGKEKFKFTRIFIDWFIISCQHGCTWVSSRVQLGLYW